MNIYLIILLTLIASIVSSYSQMFFKKGLKKKLNSLVEILETLKNKNVLIGLFGYFVSFILYIIALKGTQLSHCGPDISSSVSIRFPHLGARPRGAGEPSGGPESCCVYSSEAVALRWV